MGVASRDAARVGVGRAVYPLAAQTCVRTCVGKLCRHDPGKRDVQLSPGYEKKCWPDLRKIGFTLLNLTRLWGEHCTSYEDNFRV